MGPSSFLPNVDSAVNSIWGWTGITGGHKDARVFPRPAAAHSREHDHEYARVANDRVSQVSSSVRFFTPACRERGYRGAEGLRRYRTHILRDRISAVYEKSWMDQGQWEYAPISSPVRSEMHRTGKIY